MFSHLHVHSHYSLLDGLPKIDELVAKAVECKMPALALTDHGAMYGIIKFYKACLEAEIKPILGMEAYISPYRIDGPKAKIDKTRYHLTLLAKNIKGYKNLMRLTTIGWLKGFYYKPRIDKENLKKYGKGLIVLSGCASGQISKAVLEKGNDQAVKIIKEYQQIAGPENFFLEIGDHPESETYQKLRKIIPDLAQKLKIPLIATNDVHYLNLSEKTAQDALMCIQMNKKLEDENRLKMTDADYHFASQDEMKKKFADLPEAISNTELIADQCNVELKLGKWVFPSVELPKAIAADEYLSKLTYEGIKEKLKTEMPPDYQKRINYELDIIKTKNYASYFLVIADIVNFAKKQNIITTTRGSAAGSLVSYAIGITTADPMSFNLPFERFLNPHRPSPPDIDLDIEDARRGEVIDYVRQKYGQDKVAHIITFGTLLARAAIRDVGRVMGLPYSFCDKTAKMIPFGSQGFRMTLDRALSENPNLKQAYLENQELRQLIDLAKQVEGCVRHASLHAAGIVIAPKDLTDFTPLQKDSKQGEITTQYDMHAVEETGLLKIDLLGITNLSTLGLAREIIKRTQKKDIDIYNLPLDDKKTFEFLAQGQTMGVFQLSGSGMTRYLKELAPSNIFDIMAMISLYRPGPIESIPEYIRRKHNPELINYPHSKLKDILKMSYGVITYQDDVLLTAIELAGYDWQEADKLRKAIGKKIPREMAAQKNKFINGCMEKSGLMEQEAERIWRLIEPFAAYGFNKAHGSSYALVAYQTAYVKANYPVEFMAALLTCESGNMEKVAEGIAECQNLKIDVLPPDVGESLGGFTVVQGNNIRFGLKAIKHLGSNTVDEIIEGREKAGTYNNLENFLTRTATINKKSLEALIRAGALDRFGGRDVLDYNVETILNFAKLAREDQNSDKMSLFGEGAFARQLKLFDPPQNYNYQKLAYEKEYLGLYISAHPLDKFKAYFDKLGIANSQELKNNKIDSRFPACRQARRGNDNHNQSDSRNQVKLIGIISAIKTIKTKKGDLMIFATLEDFAGTVEVLVFPRLLQNTANIWQTDNIVLIEGAVSHKDEEVKMLADKARLVDEKNLKKMMSVSKNKKNNSADNQPKTKVDFLDAFYITVPARMSKDKLSMLKALLQKHPGSIPVYLRIDGESVKILKTSVKIEISDKLKNEIDDVIRY